MGSPTRTRYIRRQNAATTAALIAMVSLLLSIILGLIVGEFLVSRRWSTPVAIGASLVRRESEFSGLYVAGGGIALLLIAVVGLGLWRFWRSMVPRPAWVDTAATHMASPREVASLTQKGAAGTARRLGVDPDQFLGLPLGVMVASGKKLFGSLEDVGVIFAGPRTGKSSSFGIPHVLQAPGAVLATENKRGLHDHTRGARETVGKVFAFDPQSIVGEKPTWWWNPLSTITDEAKAYDLAELFAKAEMEAVSSSPNGSFFEERATTLVRGLFLAAAMSGGRYWLRDVQEWLSSPEEASPVAVEVLDGTKYREVLNELIGIYSSAPQERSGVFSTAQVMTKSLSNRQIATWVNPEAEDMTGHGRVHFDPVKFLAGANTLYSLSKDGSGSAKALVTALTVAVCDAAERDATNRPGGRMAVPLVVVLDEAANVCRWPKLPKLYSHYGSRGILIVTILQSYPQGEGVWGKAGMDALVEAANWVVYAGGNKPGYLLTLLSDAVGEYYYTTPGTPASKGSPAGRRQEHKDRIFDSAELSALPKGRAVVLSSGNRPVLVRTIPWMATSKKPLVDASLKKYDPQGEETIQEAMNSAAALRRDPDKVAGVLV